MRVMIYDLDDYTWLAWFRIIGKGSLGIFCLFEIRELLLLRRISGGAGGRR